MNLALLFMIYFTERAYMRQFLATPFLVVGLISMSFGGLLILLASKVSGLETKEMLSTAFGVNSDDLD